MSSKLVLIDSLYINNSGGFRLLDYLVRTLTKEEIQFFLIADERCRGRMGHCQNVQYMKASLRNRRIFYASHYNDFAKVFCFGNIPVPIKLKVPVYTYFHNINLLTLKEARSFKELVAMWLKRQVFRALKNNTDLWIVQTSNTSDELKAHLHESDERVIILPFYELPGDFQSLRSTSHGDDYVYISNYTGAKGHETLLEAWQLLHNRGIDKTLHLTVSNRQTTFLEKLNKAQEQGVRIINHGSIPFDKVLNLYRESKALIYPSHNESLGLGIIEAISAGCDVIGADLPYLYAICKPSVTFNPYSAISVADAVCQYETKQFEKSSLIINNKIDEIVGLIFSTNRG